MVITEKQKETLKHNNEESNRVTREAVQDALFMLMKKSDYEEIRITDIIRKSGISRSAFYRNYRTKDDVLRDCIGDMNDLLFQEFSQDVSENWRSYIRIIRKNRARIELLIKARREWFLLDQFNQLSDYSTGMDFRTVIPHGYIYNVIIYWVKCGLPGTDDEVVERFMEACRENAVIMLSGTIPKENIEMMMERYNH
ncbi:MAG: TetR/AcrR family transcriptional regulator [Erysipelotrichaceae bacterium]|nr:TetR/AcrR family transcriptional regulator [Erysipelotrichaceae bacterium]